jgi:hypothetical protein
LRVAGAVLLLMFDAAAVALILIRALQVRRLSVPAQTIIVLHVHTISG